MDQEVDNITDEHIWAGCHGYGSPSQGMTVYKDDDSTETEFREWEWLERMTKMREEGENILTDEQKARRLDEATNKGKGNSKKTHMKVWGTLIQPIIF